MSYAAKREKVFACPDPAYPSCTPPAVKRSDHRLKRFQSIFDKRAWDYCDEIRYRHLYDLMSESQTCLGIDQCHKYVPLEDLIKILMAEKDELIKQLQDRLQQSCGDQGGIKEKESLKNQIAELTKEANKSRDMLRQMMHKLENIDEIVNENKKLQCRLRCSEERVKCLEEKKKHLESELADLRSKSQIQIDLEKAQQMLSKVIQQREEFTELDEATLQNLALERNELQEKVKKLEKELDESKKKETEIEMLKKQSQSDSFDKEEMSRENECYRKKLASMKCLEKQIQELKKRGRALADKYKREAQKAAEQMNQMYQAAKELQSLREERDSLRKRVSELSSYECQFNKLQRKLQRVDAVIAENENLNSKLLALEKLEKENKYLRCRLENINEMEVNAAGDKERIMQLQCAVADQEEEMKDLLSQIERLTSGTHEEELKRLKCELYEKNSKLKLCEEQLAEIPMLEAEIDELRMKLHCCCREFSEKKKSEHSYQKMEVRFPSSSTGIRVNYKTPGKKCSSIIGIRRQINVDVKDQHENCHGITPGERGKAFGSSSQSNEKKGAMSCEEVQNLLHSSKGIISCVLEDMIEHQKEMEKLEMCNRAMKEEIEMMKKKVGNSEKDSLWQEINKLRKALEEKDLEICRLRRQSGNVQDSEDVETLRELNRQMKAELEAACIGLKQVANLEKMLETERKVRCEAEIKLQEEGQNRSKSPVESSPSESPDSDFCKALQKETEDLKLQIEALKNLTEELKKENELLRELQQPCPDFSKELDEKCALENLLSLLQAELDAFKGQKLNDECEALRNELKRVMEQNCQLKALVDCYRQRLDLEKKSNELGGLGGETGSGRTGRREEELKTLRYKLSKGQEENDNLKKSPSEFTKGQEENDNLKKSPSEFAKGQEENDNLKKSPKEFAEGQLTAGGVKEMDKTDCLKELEQLRKEKNDLVKKLEEARPLSDLLKEQEQMKKEKERKFAPGGALDMIVSQLSEPLPTDVGELQDMLRRLDAENAEKLRKLMEQHEKELGDREKAYNDNLNAMKSGYETDIRKLAERHRQSVLRLQELHEDEIEELNLNYETQLDSMQTQSEAAIKDITKGSAAKLRKLNDQHTKDIEVLEQKFHDALEEKETQYVDELTRLRSSLTKSMQELEALKKKEGAAGDPDQLKAQHAREMQKIRRTSMQKMGVIKGKFEEEKKKSDAEVELLKRKLKDQESGDGVCMCNLSKKKPSVPRDPSCPLDFNEVLERILEEGLDSLTFNEIALVHRKTCCALEGIVMKSNASPALELEPPVGDGCLHTPLLEADKQQLLSRIFTLENEIIQKQKLTQEAIISMEVAIKKERCRLQEVRNLLENEQQKNSKLKLLLNSQTKLHADLRKERDHLENQASRHQILCEEKKKQLDEEVKSKKYLEAEVETLKSKLKHLCSALDAEKGKLDSKQGDQLEQMRIKLEQTVHQERRLALQLESEIKDRMQLQCQLQTLRQSFKHMVNLPAVENDIKFAQNPLEAKSAKEKQNLDQIKEKKNKIKPKAVKKKK